MERFKLSIIVFIFLFATGCSSSKITSSWKSQNTAATAINKIMVVGLIREADRTIREKMEEHLIGDLKDMGYNAVSAYREYGPKAFNNIDEKTLIEKLKNSNIDAVITIVLLDKEKESLYKPGLIMYSPFASKYNRFFGYYTTVSDRIYSPGYYETSTKYFWESNLYDMHTLNLLYSAQTQSFAPASSESLGHEYGKIIVKNMLKNNVLAKKPLTE